MAIERLLRFALINSEIKLHYQPQNNSKNEVVVCEVLVRWNSEQLGEVAQIFLTYEECDVLPGYHFSRPVDKEDFEKYIAASLQK